MKIRTIILIVMMILLYMVVVAQLRITKHYTVANTSDPNYISDQQISGMAYDTNGTLWIATVMGGICSFDGKNWSRLTTDDGLPSNSVSDLFIDRDNSLWFGCESAAGRIANGTVEVFEDVDYVRSFYQDSQGNLWLGSNTYGVYKVSPDEQWTVYNEDSGLINNSVRDILEDDMGRLWFATYGGVSIYDGENWTHYTEENGLAKNQTQRIIRDHQGSFWFCAEFGPISILDGDTWSYEHERSRLRDIVLMDDSSIWAIDGDFVNKYENEQWTTLLYAYNMLDNQIGFTSAIKGKNDTLLIATYYRGLMKLAPDSSFVLHSPEFGLLSDWVTDIQQSADGKLWFGSNVRGISIFDGVNWDQKSFSDGTLPGERPEYILRDSKDHVWVVPGRGEIYEYSDTGLRVWDQEDGLLQTTFVRVFEDSKGYYWFGHYQGASRFDGNIWTHFTDQDGLAIPIRYIAEDRDGRIWLAGTEKISKLDGTDFIHFARGENGLANGIIWSLFIDSQNHVWAGTNRGLSLYDYESGSWLTYDYTNSNIHQRQVYSIAERDSQLWLGTYEGVEIFDGFEFNALSLEHPYLSEITVFDIYFNDQGKIWLGTRENGVLVADLTTPVGPSRDDEINLQVFPNPTRGNVMIRWNQLSGEYDILIFDLAGNALGSRRLLLSQGELEMLDLSSLAKGVYMLKFQNENQSFTAKIVVN